MCHELEAFQVLLPEDLIFLFERICTVKASPAINGDGEVTGRAYAYAFIGDGDEKHQV